MTIRIAQATTDDDFRAVARLFDVMATWDVAMSARQGFSEDEIRAAFYADDVDDLARLWRADDAIMLLGWDGADAVGCIGFEFEAGRGKIARFFVEPAARRMGVGRQLFDSALTTLRARGVVHVRLMTADFMHAAHALYQAQGFVFCPPFEDVGDRLAPHTLFMERMLTP